MTRSTSRISVRPHRCADDGGGHDHVPQRHGPDVGPGVRVRGRRRPHRTGLDPAPLLRSGFFEPYRRTGRFLPFEQDTILIPGIRSLATPGHTPGHTSFLVESRGQTLLVLGDLVHLGALQFADPSLVTSFDGDRAGGAAQRARIFSLAANQNLWVAGAHLPFPGIGHLRTDGNGYRWAPIDYPIPR
ncbi:MAG: MBL fold metallo-hydrolase [Gemmatimonadales bacterium]